MQFCTSKGLSVTVIDLLTRLGQICFFFVKTSQYSLVAVFQEMSVIIIITRFRIDVRIRIRHRSGFHLGPERLLPLVPRSNPGLIPQLSNRHNTFLNLLVLNIFLVLVNQNIQIVKLFLHIPFRSF